MTNGRVQVSTPQSEDSQFWSAGQELRPLSSDGVGRLAGREETCMLSAPAIEVPGVAAVTSTQLPDTQSYAKKVFTTPRKLT